MKDKPKAGIQKKRVRRARVDKRLKKLEDEVQLLRAEIDAMRAAKVGTLRTHLFHFT